MDWDKIRVFHAVADAGSFTHAGETLALSQSAVSRQIGALENELKVALFHRHARGLILTEQGEMLYRTAHDMYAQLAAAQARLTDSKDKPVGTLKITTTVGLGSNWLTPRLTEFIELYPGIQVELMLEDRELDLGMREADVAIRLRRPTQGDLIQRKLFTVHYHVFAAPSYLARYGTPTKVSDLDDHTIITFGLRTPEYLNDINKLATVGRSSRSPREPAVRINNVHAMRRAVENGVGIAMLPDYVVAANANLVQLLKDIELPEFDTYFVYPEELRASKRIAVFRDFLLSKAKQWSF